MTYVHYADDRTLLANISAQSEFLLLSLEQAAKGVDLYMNANKTECTYVLNKKEF